MDQFLQSIPRPEEVRRIAATPWSAVPPARRTSVDLRAVRAAFPVEPLREPVVGDPGAAVLCAVRERDGEAELILIRRSLALGRDPGLVALPGGLIEPGEHPADAALREAFEEVGLAPSEVELRACIGVFERRQGIPVVAYLGTARTQAVLQPNADEVHEIFEVRLSELLAEGAAWQEEWGPSGKHRVISFFTSMPTLGRNLVWGLTAAVLWRLLEQVASALGEP